MTTPASPCLAPFPAGNARLVVPASAGQSIDESARHATGVRQTWFSPVSVAQTSSLLCRRLLAGRLKQPAGRAFAAGRRLGNLRYGRLEARATRPRTEFDAPLGHATLNAPPAESRDYKLRPSPRGASSSLEKACWSETDRATSRRAAACWGPERGRNASTPAGFPARCDRGTGRGPLRPSPAQALWHCRKPSLMQPRPSPGTLLSFSAHASPAIPFAQEHAALLGPQSHWPQPASQSGLIFNLGVRAQPFTAP